jgi:hypothetical protein
MWTIKNLKTLIMVEMDIHYKPNIRDISYSFAEDSK